MIQDPGSPTQDARWRHHPRVTLSSDAEFRYGRISPPIRIPHKASPRRLSLARAPSRHRVRLLDRRCPPGSVDARHRARARSARSGHHLFADAHTPPHVPHRNISCPPLGNPQGQRWIEKPDTGGHPKLKSDRTT